MASTAVDAVSFKSLCRERFETFNKECIVLVASKKPTGMPGLVLCLTV